MTLSSADQQARSRFQSGLLAWLRAADDASGLREMVAVVRGQAVDDAPNALLWRSAESFLQAILDGTLSPDDEARKICRRLERHLGGRNTAEDPSELRQALFDFVSNRKSTPGGGTLDSSAGAVALLGTLGAAAEVLPLLSTGLNDSPARRFDDAQITRWQGAARVLDDAWHRLLTGNPEGCRAAATGLVEVALELSDPPSLQLAEALADAAGLAEDPSRRELPAFRAAFAAALEVAVDPDGPRQKAFDDKASRLSRRLAESRSVPAQAVLPGSSPRWFAEDAHEWVRELAAAIDAVPPKRLVLLSGLDWLARQESCNMMAIRGLATIAHGVIRQVRTDDLDQPDTHALLVDTIAALSTAIDEMANGHPPLPDEDVFGRLRALGETLATQRRQLSSTKPSQ
jgi:hypothetical protein